MENDVIMLVEDNPDDVALTLRALKKNNMSNEVVIAKDGEEALDYLFATGMYADRDVNDLPAIILLDLNLPKINGLEVLAAIRQHEVTKGMPVVILTSSSEQKDLVDGYNLGVNSYIRKPVDFQAFTEAVRLLGVYWLVLNESPTSRR